jgi:hypothetical protein
VAAKQKRLEKNIEIVIFLQIIPGMLEKQMPDVFHHPAF